jgi:cell surface protein SprA
MPKGLPMSKDVSLPSTVTLRDEVTQQYLLSDEALKGRPNRGQKSLQFNPTVEYQMYKNLAIRVYFEYQSSTPYTPGSYSNTNMSAGTVVRYMFN